jgi:hypothetical protein
VWTSAIYRDALDRKNQSAHFCLIMIAERAVERLFGLHAGRLAHLIAKANTVIVKMHFRRKTRREESKFPTENYRRYANA